MVGTGKIEAPAAEDSGLPRLKRKFYENRWWVVYVFATFVIFVLPKWSLGNNFSYAAWTCSLAVAAAVHPFSAAKMKLWFWLAVPFIALLHVVTFCSIHWTKESYLGAIYRPLCIVDGAITFGLMWLAQKIAMYAAALTSSRTKDPTT